MKDDDAIRCDAIRCAAEVEALPEASRLCESGPLLVAQARATQIPELLREIGRRREEAFRGGGRGHGPRSSTSTPTTRTTRICSSGTGRAARWPARTGWCGPTSFAASQLPHALYTHALFDYDAEFLARLGPALELGRAFVAPEYQRCSRVLAMLWKGIGRALEVANVRALFGAVSVSARYSRRSRGMIAAALATHHRYEHAQLVRARVPFALEVADFAAAADLADPRALSARVAELEPDGAGLPVLVKRYLELGGEFAAWHVDRDFGGSLDGLMVLELARADRARVARYSESFASAPRTSSVVS